MGVRTDFPRRVRRIDHTWIPLSDGTQLAARIWLPEDAERDPVPAILEYLPYRKGDAFAKRDTHHHPYFAGHGYAGVRVDLRGSGDSDGILADEYLPLEQEDGVELIAWLAEQPWCSGEVGMIGISWGGFNGLQIAARRPPALGADISMCASDDRYAEDVHYIGGCVLGVDMLQWAATMLTLTAMPPDPAAVGEGWRDTWLARMERSPALVETWLRHQRRAEWGMCATPVYLTATMSVGRVYDGAVAAAVAVDPMVGVDEVVIPVVAECDDSWLNDARVVQVEAEDAARAVAAAGGEVEQGAVGAGTGMTCLGYKGGIGTASRVAGEGGPVVGVLVLANFGDAAELRVDGVPVGRLLGDPDTGPAKPAGSCIAVVATDAPLSSAALSRLARRAGLGLARTGSVAHHGSGEIFLGFSTTTAPDAPTFPDADLDPLFSAAVEATEEAVLNALWNAERTVGREGRVAHALPHDRVLELLDEHHRLIR